MAFSTALSQALNKRIRTSDIQSVKSQIGSQIGQLKDAYQSQDMYDLSGGKIMKAPASTAMGGYNPSATTGTGAPGVISDGMNTYDTTTGKGTTNGTLDATGKPIATTGTESNTGATGTTDEGLAAYKANLGITPEDEAARQKNYTDFIAANNEKSNYSSSDYYNQLVQNLGRTEEQGKLNNLQGSEINQRAAATLQQNEVSKGDEGMLSQARQNAARMLPLNQQLQTNIAQQNLEVNKLNNIDQQISIKMQLKSADLNNKVQSIQSNLDALKGKVPDYMLNYANQQLQLKQQETTAKMQDTLKNGDINSTDPYLKKKAIQNSVQNVFDQYQGLPMNQGVGVHVANIEGLMANGMTLDQAINQDLIKSIQSKPEFKQWQTSKGLVQNPNTVINQQLQNEKLKQDIESGKLIKSQDWMGNPIFIDQKTRKQVDITTGSYVDGSGSYTPPNTSSTTSNTSSGYTVTPGTSPRRPDVNNNPGNLKMGDVGYGVDDLGHTKFKDAQQGFEYLIKDLTGKLTGNTRTGLTTNSTLADLGKVYAEDPNWGKSVASISGYSLDTKLSDIDVNKLAPAIARQEGFTGTVTSNQEQKTQNNDKGVSFIGQDGQFHANKEMENYIMAPANNKVALSMAAKSIDYKGNSNDFSKVVDQYKTEKINAMYPDISDEAKTFIKNNSLSDMQIQSAISAAKDWNVDIKSWPTKAGDRQATVALAKQINPDWSETKQSKVNDLMDENGTTSKTISAANTAFTHMASIVPYIDAAKNGDIQAINNIRNEINTAFGDASATNLGTMFNTIAPELAKIYKPQLTDSEIKSFSEIMSPKMSPQQILGAFKTQIGLTGGKLSTEIDKFKDPKTGKLWYPNAVNSLFLPHGKSALESMGMKVDQDTGEITLKDGNTGTFKSSNGKTYSDYFKSSK